MYLVLTDRVTGTLYWVTFNLNQGQQPPDGLGRVAITTNLPANPPKDRPTANAQDPKPFIYNNIALYDAWAEPIIGFWDPLTFSRLIVSNGSLGASLEVLDTPQGNNGPIAPPLYVIQTYVGVANPKIGYNGEYVQIILTPGATKANPSYTWVAYSLTQTPNPAPVNGAQALASGGKKDV